VNYNSFTICRRTGKILLGYAIIGVNWVYVPNWEHWKGNSKMDRKLGYYKVICEKSTITGLTWIHHNHAKNCGSILFQFPNVNRNRQDWYKNCLKYYIHKIRKNFYYCKPLHQYFLLLTHLVIPTIRNSNHFLIAILLNTTSSIGNKLDKILQNIDILKYLSQQTAEQEACAKTKKIRKPATSTWWLRFCRGFFPSAVLILLLVSWHTNTSSSHLLTQQALLPHQIRESNSRGLSIHQHTQYCA
jgi:hypothetical protein